MQKGVDKSQRGNTPSERMADYLGVSIDKGKNDKEKWDILSKELSQKQELIHRMLKELDDKTESLKITVMGRL